MNQSIKVCASSGMVNIEAPWLFYGNIRGMYKGGRDGHGVQVSAGVDKDAAAAICAQIAGLVYELQGLAPDKKEDKGSNRGVR